jgi:hypothetical protein
MDCDDPRSRQSVLDEFVSEEMYARHELFLEARILVMDLQASVASLALLGYARGRPLVDAPAVRFGSAFDGQIHARAFVCDSRL